jgi:hypothetical protein
MKIILSDIKYKILWKQTFCKFNMFWCFKVNHRVFVRPAEKCLKRPRRLVSSNVACGYQCQKMDSPTQIFHIKKCKTNKTKKLRQSSIFSQSLLLALTSYQLKNVQLFCWNYVKKHQRCWGKLSPNKTK